MHGKNGRRGGWGGGVVGLGDGRLVGAGIGLGDGDGEGHGHGHVVVGKAVGVASHRIGLAVLVATSPYGDMTSSFTLPLPTVRTCIYL